MGEEEDGVKEKDGVEEKVEVEEEVGAMDCLVETQVESILLVHLDLFS